MTGHQTPNSSSSSSSSSNTKSSSYRSQKATAADLSVLEKLDVVPAIMTTLASTVLALFTGVWYAKERRPESYFRYVALTAVRTFIERMSPRQQHYLAPPTDDAYELVCRKRGQQPSSEILADGTRAHWIGRRRASKLLINFHGGGYVMPASESMVEFMFQVVGVLEREGKDAACLFLSYDLAPGAIYPRQLQQAATLLNHVLHTLHYAPSSIFMSGDSAGGNLCVALLSHLMHPHPSATVPAVTLPSPRRLGGLVLISPWVSFGTGTPSFAENAWKDCVSPTAGTAWSSAFLGCAWPHAAARDAYAEPAAAPPGWWRGLAACVGPVLVVCGAQEVLRDGIVQWVERLREAAPGVECSVLAAEYHDQPSIDLQLGFRESDEGATAKLVKSWLASRLS